MRTARRMGLEGLTDRSRRPYRQANKLRFQVESLIISLKKEQPSWGALKIREKLIRLYPDLKTPTVSTVHAVLDRHGRGPVRHKCVTYVSGIICNPCVRVVQLSNGAPGRIRTLDPQIRRNLPAGFRASRFSALSAP